MSNHTTHPDTTFTAFYLSKLQQCAERHETPSSTFGEQAVAAFADVVEYNAFHGRSEILALAEALAKLANPNARLVFGEI